MPNRESESALLARYADLMGRRPAVRSIVLLITQGQSRKEIAAQLGSSKHTIDWHLRRLYRDLGVRSMAEIVRLETLTTLALQDAPP